MKLCPVKFDLIINLTQFEATTWLKHNTQVAIKQMDIYEFGLKDSNNKIPKKTTGNVIKSNKCNQCDYASSQAVDLRTHLKTHSGEKPNKCSQCNFASIETGTLMRHFKTHSGEKSKKCNQCAYESSFASALRAHLKTHSGETNATNVTMPLLRQAI